YVVRRSLQEWSTLVAHAEELPVGDHGFDAVVAAQAFHWFDLDRALPEIARALKRGGRLGLVWNYRDDSIPWVRRLGAIIGNQEQLADPGEALDASGRVASRAAARLSPLAGCSAPSRRRGARTASRSTARASRTWCSPGRTSRCSTGRRGPP